MACMGAPVPPPPALPRPPACLPLALLDRPSRLARPLVLTDVAAFSRSEHLKNENENDKKQLSQTSHANFDPFCDLVRG